MPTQGTPGNRSRSRLQRRTGRLATQKRGGGSDGHPQSLKDDEEVVPGRDRQPEVSHAQLEALPVRHSRAARGIVQVQVVMSGHMTPDDATDAARTLLEGAIPLLAALAEGQIHDHANPR